MDTAQWPQEIKVKPMEEIVVVPNTLCSKPSLERRVRPQKEQALNCPRCNSTNTKFCYYNNYSLSQPRYFCKTCRRYWTEGGTLRSIPVGGGSRKNKRSSSLSSPSSSSKKLPDLVLPPSSHQNPKNHHDHQVQDLNLAFPTTHDFKTISELIQVPNFDHNNKNLSAMELLTGISTSRGLNNITSFMPMPMPNISDPNTIYSSTGFSFQEFKPTLNFSLDHGIGNGGGNGYGGLQESSNSGRLLFPFEDLKQVSSTSGVVHDQQNRDQQGDSSNGYWNGMLGGGSW